MPTPLMPDMAVFQRKLATLPLATYQAGETVLSAASTTGRLLILKKGAVAVVKVCDFMITLEDCIARRPTA